jgi:hypothetical protein
VPLFQAKNKRNGILKLSKWIMKLSQARMKQTLKNATYKLDAKMLP